MSISIYDSINNAKTQKTFTVEIDDPKVSFVVAVCQREQRKLINQYIRASVTTNKADNSQELRIAPDWYGLGMELAEYISAWGGFSEPFDKTAAKDFLALFGNVCEALGRNFKEMLEAYEARMLSRSDAEAKNS